jgi:hypothetical protein
VATVSRVFDEHAAIVAFSPSGSQRYIGKAGHVPMRMKCVGKFAKCNTGKCQPHNLYGRLRRRCLLATAEPLPRCRDVAVTKAEQYPAACATISLAACCA